MKKRIRLSVVAMLAFVMVLTTACDQEKQDKPNNNSGEKSKYTVELYYANEKYIETGDENLDELMEPIETTLEASAETVYGDTLLKLRDLPEGKTGYATMVLNDITFNSVKLDGDIAYVDLSSENLSGGSLQEMLFVEQVVETLTESFEEIDKVQFTVDGKVAETLMGHIDTSLPLD